ncbi:hypothetical protein AAC03nite_27610 [Alicyclobacillus acidoterrestris]|nr:hypothetical protein AAC03nite_27610 [Alicyclobacillus acidoterrestris]
MEHHEEAQLRKLSTAWAYYPGGRLHFFAHSMTSMVHGWLRNGLQVDMWILA